MSKINMEFRLCDNNFFVSVASILQAMEEHPEMDLVETIKVNVHNLQNAIQGLPMENGFKIQRTDYPA